MPTETLPEQLHDKATRGIPLSADEQAELDTWYAEQDRAESHLLGVTGVPELPADLQARVEGALNKLLQTTQKIQELTAQNEAVRREIAELQRYLIQPLST